MRESILADFARHTFALNAVAVGVIVLAILTIALASTVLIHHLWSDQRRRRNRERYEGAAAYLAKFIVTSRPLAAHLQHARKRYGDRAVSLVLRRARHDLKGDSAEVITHALDEMGAIDALATQSRSRSAWKRAAAVRGLGECGGTKALEALVAARADEVPEVRRAARESLLSDGSDRALSAAIESFLADLPHRAGWRRAFYARLAATGSDRLAHLIESRSLAPAEEKLALEALGDAASEKGRLLAIERIESEDAEMRATATRVVGKTGSDEDLPRLLARLEDPEWFVRAAAARSFELLLARRLDSTTSDMRRATDLLANLLHDSSWWVRANSARALSHSGEAGVGQLFRVSEGSDAYARDAAVAALAMGDLGESDRERLRTTVDQVLSARTQHSVRPRNSEAAAPGVA